MHKIYFLLLLLLSPLFIKAQELDETYLSSLPEDIRKDIEDRIEENKESEEPTFRLSDVATDLEKPESDSLYDVYGSRFFESYSILPIPYYFFNCLNLFIFKNDKINKSNAAVIIEGPDAELNCIEENNPTRTANMPPIIDKTTIC